MHLDEEETELCNYLSEALLMRQPVGGSQWLSGLVAGLRSSYLSRTRWRGASRTWAYSLEARGRGLRPCPPGFMAQGDYTLMLYKVGLAMG